MRKVLHWRKATWALALWSGYLATWMVLTGSGPAIVVLWWLVGLGVLQSIVQPLYQTGRIEPSRRHGPFDPRFSPRPDPRLPLATNDELTATPEQADTGADRRPKNAVQDWESEGGAIAEPPRANPTAQGRLTQSRKGVDSSDEQSDRQDPPLATPRQETEDLADAMPRRPHPVSGRKPATRRRVQARTGN